MSVLVEVLTIPGCAHATEVMSAARACVAETNGHGVDIRHVIVRDLAQAESLGFPGSPTVRVDGLDIDPEAPRTPAFACRLYSGRSGVRGGPDEGLLLAALRTAISREAVTT